jgi:DNA-binding XRE family transcriptional regulator
VLLKRLLPTRLRRARQRKRLTQAHIGQLAGVSRCTIMSLEGGQCDRLRVRTLMLICAALDRSADYFLGIDKPVLAVAAILPGLFPIHRTADSTEIQKCFACDSLLGAEPHQESACMLANYERGRTPAWLGIFYATSDEHVLRLLFEEQGDWSPCRPS